MAYLALEMLVALFQNNGAEQAPYYKFSVKLRAIGLPNEEEEEAEQKREKPTAGEMADWYNEQLVMGDTDLLTLHGQATETKHVSHEWVNNFQRCDFIVEAETLEDARDFASLIADPDDDCNAPLNEKWCVQGQYSNLRAEA